MKKVKLIMKKLEICTLDCSDFKGIESFNIYTYLRKFLERQGWDDQKKFCTTVDFLNHVCHIYAYTSAEVDVTD